VAETLSGLCAEVGFGIRSFESLGSSTTVLVLKYIYYLSY
jgi:hypothetical protein